MPGNRIKIITSWWLPLTITSSYSVDPGSAVIGTHTLMSTTSSPANREPCRTPTALP